MIRTPGADPERIQAPHARDDDEGEVRLRPRRLDEFVGQEALKAQLTISIRAAADRGEALDHVLLAGPPGLGKTSLARIVAEELDVPFIQTAGPALEQKRDPTGSPVRRALELHAQYPDRRARALLPKNHPRRDDPLRHLPRGQ